MINITIIYDSDVIIQFNYDKTLVEIVKTLPAKLYIPEEKSWWIPYCLLNNFLDKIRGLPYNIRKIELEKNYELAKTFKFKTTPYQHQVDGFKYGVARERFLLGDDMGLGKSKEAIDISIYKKLLYGVKHCLVICGVKTLVHTWEREIIKHSDEGSHILGNYVSKKGKVKSGSNLKKLEDLENINNLPFFLITNIETIRNKEICNKLIELIDSKEIDIILFDEFHKVKNSFSQQGEALLKLKPTTRIAMTGTPLVNSPLDLFAILNWLDIERHNFYAFRNHYCTFGNMKEITGYKNLEELNAILNMIMLRRKKEDVLDLPPKVHTTEYLEMSKVQEKIYEEVKTELIENIDKIALSNNPLAELIRLRQATAFTGILSTSVRESVKYDRAMDIIEEVVSNNGKIIILSQWVEVLKPLIKVLSEEGYNPAVIIGGVNKQEQENKFMNDSSCKVLLGSITSMGVGLTLTAANTVIFLDSPWTKTDKTQAEDRTHRIGTNGTVNIITLVCSGTIDERVEQIVESKGELSDFIVDGQIKPKNKVNMLRYLLS